MTRYINPPDMTKEEWLRNNAILCAAPSMDLVDDTYTLVCHVDNFHFSAAAVVETVRDYEDFCDPADRRPKRWFLVTRSLLDGVVP